MAGYDLRAGRRSCCPLDDGPRRQPDRRLTSRPGRHSGPGFEPASADSFFGSLHWANFRQRRVELAKSARTRSRTYRSWEAMLRRCRVPTDPAYKNYGGRGIKVCDRWHSYDLFIEDMGMCPDGLTIDRLNVNEGYLPGNCRWATRLEQGENKRSNKEVIVGGRTVNQAEAARLVGLEPRTLHYRLKSGWDEHQALSTPAKGKKRSLSAQTTSVMHTYRGRQVHQAELARIAGITPGLMHTRLKAGWSIEKAVTTPVRGK